MNISLSDEALSGWDLLQHGYGVNKSAVCEAIGRMALAGLDALEDGRRLWLEEVISRARDVQIERARRRRD